MSDEQTLDSVEDAVLVEERSGVLLITLNRPARLNSINAALASQLWAAIERLESDARLRAGIITATGRAFCSGMDLKAFAKGEDISPFMRFIKRGSTKPLLAAIDGTTFGGGLELALTCDLLIVGRDATLGLPETRVGLFAAGGGLLWLTRRVGYGKAMEMAMTAEPITAAEAYDCGLATRLAEPGQALTVALEVAERVARNAPLAVAASKELIRAALDATEPEFWQLQKAPYARVSSAPTTRRKGHGLLPRSARRSGPEPDLMVTNLLEGLRIVEGSAFVAAPLGGMTLAQLGADVIRFDAIGGGIDFHRWPVNPEGTSLFWSGMNKGKRSIAVDVRDERAQELLTALICRPGRDRGILLSNFPAAGWLADDRLRAQRDDLIYVNIIGNPDGSTAVDYTVNPSSGFAYATGPVGSVTPTNHVLPAWDIATGLTAATSLLAAERHRTRHRVGALITLALADVAFAMVANLGYLAQAQVLGETRPPIGNDMYGAFGRDFSTADGRRVMVVAISSKQWRSLARATEIEPPLSAIEAALGLDFNKEGDRFRGRDALAALIRPWIEARTLDCVGDAFNRLGVCWGAYQTFSELLTDDWRCSPVNPMFADVEQPGLGQVRMPGSPVSASTVARQPASPAPRLGEHTTQILAEDLGLTAHEIGELYDAGVVAGDQ